MPARADTKLRRAINRTLSVRRLREAGIAFEERNHGAHLIVAGAWAFFPGTGAFHHLHGSQEGRGVFNLIKIIKEGHYAR